jgi:hypothetical protein
MMTGRTGRQDQYAAFTAARARKRLTAAAGRGSAAFESEVRKVLTETRASARMLLPPEARFTAIAKRVVGGAVLMGESAGEPPSTGESAPRRSFWRNLLKGVKAGAGGPLDVQAPGKEPKPEHFGSTIGPHLAGPAGPKLGEPTVMPEAGGENDGGVKNWVAAWLGTHRGEIDLHALYDKAIEEFTEVAVGSEETFVAEVGLLAERLWFANFDRESGKVRIGL